MSRRSNAILTGYLLLIFAAGVVLGAFGDRLFAGAPASTVATDPEAVRQKILSDLQRRLDLRPDQVKQFNATFDATRAKLHEIQRKMEPDLDAVRTGQDKSMRAILDDRQRAEYDKWRAEREKQRKAFLAH